MANRTTNWCGVAALVAALGGCGGSDSGQADPGSGLACGPGTVARNGLCVIDGGAGAGGGNAGHSGGGGLSGNGGTGATSAGGSGPGGQNSGGSAGQGQAGSGQAGQGQAGSGNAGSGQAGQGQAGQGNAGQGNAGSGTAGSGTAGSGAAGSGTAGSGQAGSGQAGSGQAGSGQAGSGQAGQGTAGQGQAGSGPIDDMPRLAESVTLREVALFQTVKVSLESGGVAAAPRNGPVVAGKDAIVRAYVDPGAGFTPRTLRAELVITINGQPTLFTDEHLISGASSESAPSSLFSFVVPAAFVDPSASFSVRLVDAAASPVSGPASSPARYPADGGVAPLGAALAGGPVQVVLVPLRYDTDGSARLPDTSDAQLALFRGVIQAVYPLNTVELTVHAPVPWSQFLTFTGNVPFNTVNSTLIDLKAQDNAPPETYYYALIKPADTFDNYCGGSCVTGQSYVVEDGSDGSTRVGGGMGYSGEDAAWTLAHELGHMHGRSHSPCGVSSWDPDFPYSTGGAGVWGLDSRSGTFLDPSVAVDLMGYCDPLWISDYTYRAIFQRIQAVNGVAQQVTTPKAKKKIALLPVDEGRLSWGRVTALPQLPAGLPVRVRWRDDAGRVVAQGEGSWLRAGHGGGLVAAEPAAGATAVEVELQGRWEIVSVNGE